MMTKPPQLQSPALAQSNGANSPAFLANWDKADRFRGLVTITECRLRRVAVQSVVQILEFRIGAPSNLHQIPGRT